MVRYILKRRNYRRTYRDKVRSALIKGTSVQEVSLDRALYGGLGDVGVREWDVKNFSLIRGARIFSRGGPASRQCACPARGSNSTTLEQEPLMRTDAYARLLPGEGETDDEQDMLLVEYWYKRADPGGGGTRVHMAKMAGGVLLEDSRKAWPDGLYTHGLYPFIVEPLFRISGRPWGMGIADVFGPLQFMADRLDQIILRNALMSGRLKLLVDKGADVDMDALTDYSREVVRAGRIDDAVRWFSAMPLNPVVQQPLQREAPDDKGGIRQNQLNRARPAQRNGGQRHNRAAGGGGQGSRLLIQQMADGFEQLAYDQLSLSRSSTPEERKFLVRGPAGESRMISFGAQKLGRPVPGQEGLRAHFDFDVRIEAQKQTPVEAAYRNELAMRLLQISGGLMTPVMAIEMMDFEGKERVLAQLRERAGEQDTGI